MRRGLPPGEEVAVGYGGGTVNSSALPIPLLQAAHADNAAGDQQQADKCHHENLPLSKDNLILA